MGRPARRLPTRSWGSTKGAGDTIKLTGTDTDAYAMAHTQLQPNGLDTKITLNDGSTILLKWVSSVDTTTLFK